MEHLRTQIVSDPEEEPLLANEIVGLISEIMATLGWHDPDGDPGESWSAEAAVAYTAGLLGALHRALGKRLGFVARPTKTATYRDANGILAERGFGRL